ncbi:MAG: hypothetical protein GKR94_02395 [Gammaproteobacteria bacterium]|nr:hypothetical protein [Gammaproteobacteria bacterium]
MANEQNIGQALDILTGETLAPQSVGSAPDPATAAPACPWMHSQGVCGIGLAERVTSGQQLIDDLTLKVYVERKLPTYRCEHLVPSELNLEELGPIPIDVEEIGRLELHAASRPASPGSSISLAGNFSWTGTFGMVAHKRGKATPLYLVGSSHVIAISGLANVGDQIVQPAASAGGQAPQDVIANLSEWVPLKFSNTAFNNLVDAAIAELTPGAATAAIAGLGIPAGVSTKLARGMNVQKVGAQTSYSIAQIKDVNLRLPSSYPTANGQIARAGFTDQVLTTFYAAPGDSSAPVLNMQGELVGQHFAGSASVGIFSKIQNLLDALDLELVTAADDHTCDGSDCQSALDEHEQRLSALPNVTGFGMVDAADGSNAKGQAIAVYVERKMDVASEDRVPSTLPIVIGGKQKSVPTRVIESGKITPGG